MRRLWTPTAPQGPQGASGTGPCHEPGRLKLSFCFPCIRGQCLRCAQAPVLRLLGDPAPGRASKCLASILLLHGHTRPHASALDLVVSIQPSVQLSILSHVELSFLVCLCRLASSSGGGGGSGSGVGETYTSVVMCGCPEVYEPPDQLSLLVQDAYDCLSKVRGPI